MKLSVRLCLIFTVLAIGLIAASGLTKWAIITCVNESTSNTSARTRNNMVVVHPVGEMPYKSDIYVYPMTDGTKAYILEDAGGHLIYLGRNAP